ncbi:MAG: DEAD/DEAH box helicase [Verrucomicrobia bacterium]|nr:DEAD/DEAH box helicase [Verrucomicrobiota bacterium]
MAIGHWPSAIGYWLLAIDMDAFEFHPAVEEWFRRRFGTPTPPQAQGWPAIQSGRHVLLSAPTGSGKTLAAFLSALDGLFREASAGGLPDETRVVYVSPLKALSNDIHKNLAEPLAGIRAVFAQRGPAVPEVRAEVRTGDTPSNKRRAIAKKPPHILVTTPESLYLLLTSNSGRNLLRTVRTLIVDEIHAVVSNRRGAHLAISMERLEALAGRPLQRIGLSATQRPIDEVARFLVGSRPLISSSSAHTVPIAAFPLTPALSPGERENHPLRQEEVERVGIGDPAARVPPLPAGEGRGEGEGTPLDSGRSHSVGAGIDHCAVIEIGHRRDFDLLVEIPNSPLQAVMSNEVWEEVYGRLAELIEQHQTTLVFVNTRRLAERVTHHLCERLGADKVTSHHGSLSAKLRLEAENRLKRGELKALVATASLELGIDIGSVDLVCQLGSTRSISTLLQRVGRAEHRRGGRPKGRLFPLTRDELAECAALIRCIRRGELDALQIPEKPLDILAQQIVACAACEDWGTDELFRLMRQAYPYQNLARGEFDDTVRMLADGFSTRRGRRGALIHFDAVNGRIRARRGARLIALTSGGAIPDNADYRVVLEPTETFIGTVNEDFAMESMAGDVFQLGNASWKILRLNSGIVRVQDAHGQPPNIPFWLGEAPARTAELSQAVSDLRGEIEESFTSAQKAGARPPQPRPLSPHPSPLPTGEGESSAVLPTDRRDRIDQAQDQRLPLPAGEGRGEGERGTIPRSAQDTSRPLAGRIDHLESAAALLVEETGLSSRAALQVAEYFASVHSVLGAIPTQTRIVMERFFDESGGMQLVIHAPFGSRINRAWGLALRKRFCRQFNFELQAAATDDAIVLSLGTQHSFPLEEVFRYLRPNSVRGVLVQALLDAPMFTIRWRWNVSRALAVPRQRGNRRTPPPLQRMEAEDLIAAVFPEQLACLENIVGDREIPDHPLVNQTLGDCLIEAMDIDGLIHRLEEIEAGTIQCVAKDLPEPSPLAHEILNAKPYAFLDNAPIEERRTQAVYARRALDLDSQAELGVLDAAAIERVREQAWPNPVSEDEMHDALLQLGVITEEEAENGWLPFLRALAQARRATRVFIRSRVGAHRLPPHPGPLPPGEGEPIPAHRRAEAPRSVWVAAERLSMVRATYPDSTIEEALSPPGTEPTRDWERTEALRELIRGRLEVAGPVTAAELSRYLELPSSEIETALVALEGEGFVLRGRFRPKASELEWCERRLLARIHRLTINRLRAEIQAVPIRDFCRFLTIWQRVDEDHRAQGPQGVEAVLEILDGYELGAGAWEPDVLSARVKDYDPKWLDLACFTGRFGWGRLTMPQPQKARTFQLGPLRSSPIALFKRANLPAWFELCPQVSELDLSPDTEKVLEILLREGALFFAELVRRSGLLPSQAEQALGELVALGLVTADSFDGLRALLVPSHKKPTLAGATGTHRHRTITSVEFAGRWSLLSPVRARPALRWQEPLREPGRSGRESAPFHDQSRLTSAATAHAPNARGNHLGAFSEPSVGSRQGDEADLIKSEIQNPKSIEVCARTILRRYGVVFRRLLEREAVQVPWYELGRIYRRLEARGEIRGGHFVSGVSGEQFALPEAIQLLRSIRKEAPRGQWIALSAADPLNLAGILTPGRRVAAVGSNRILLRDGVPVGALEAGEIVKLDPAAEESGDRVARALKIGKMPALLRRYYA